MSENPTETEAEMPRIPETLRENVEAIVEILHDLQTRAGINYIKSMISKDRDEEVKSLAALNIGQKLETLLKGALDGKNFMEVLLEDMEKNASDQ